MDVTMKLTHILATSVVLSALLGCTEQQVDDKKIQMRNGVAYIPNSTEPYTGTSTSAYENGQTKQSRTWTKGMLVKLNKWYENGFEALSYSPTHIKALNEQGQTVLDAKLMNSKVVSTTQIESKGETMQFSMHNGVITSIQTLEDGKLTSTSEFKDGYIAKEASNIEFTTESGAKCVRNDLRVFAEQKSETFYAERSYIFGCDDSEEPESRITLSDDGTQIISHNKQFDTDAMKFGMVEKRSPNTEKITKMTQPLTLIENESTLFLLEQHWAGAKRLHFVEDLANTIVIDYSEDGERLEFIRVNAFGFNYSLFESDLKDFPNIEPSEYATCEINEQDIESNALCIAHLKEHVYPLLGRLNLTSRTTG